jgi:hypothetical protein
MKITFENSLYIKKINFSNNTLILNIVYKSDDEVVPLKFYEWKGNKIIFQTPDDEYKTIEISEAELTFENINEIWWDDWWDEVADVALWSIKLDNIHWRHDVLGNLQYNAPKHDVDWDDLNDLNISEWYTALWDSKIELDSEDLSNCNYHFTLDIPHDLIKKKNWSMQYKPVHIKGRELKIDIKEYSSNTRLEQEPKS